MPMHQSGLDRMMRLTIVADSKTFELIPDQIEIYKMQLTYRFAF